MPVELPGRWVKTRRRQPHLSDHHQSCPKTVNLSSIVSKLNRFPTGYDLRHVFNGDMTRFDLLPAS